MITLTTDEGLKITIFIQHINYFYVHQYAKVNCRIWTTARDIDVQETYDQVLALINNALK